MLQSIVTLQQLLNGNAASALFWRSVFGNPLEVVALATLVVLVFGLTLSFIVDLSKYNILRATFGALLAYILFAVISAPVFGEEISKMTAYTMGGYVFFVEGIVKDEAFLNYIRVIGSAIAWIATQTASVVKWTLLQLERAFSYSLVATQFCLVAFNAFIDALAVKLFFLWSRLQEERLRKATRTVEVKAEASDK
jgi:hypothetical protein